MTKQQYIDAAYDFLNQHDILQNFLEDHINYPNHSLECKCSDFVNCGILWHDSSLGRDWSIYSYKLSELNLINGHTSIKEFHAALLEKSVEIPPYEFW